MKCDFIPLFSGFFLLDVNVQEEICVTVGGYSYFMDYHLSDVFFFWIGLSRMQPTDALFIPVIVSFSSKHIWEFYSIATFYLAKFRMCGLRHRIHLNTDLYLRTTIKSFFPYFYKRFIYHRYTWRTKL